MAFWKVSSITNSVGAAPPPNKATKKHKSDKEAQKAQMEMLNSFVLFVPFCGIVLVHSYAL